MNNYNILALDGGGVKGIFTIAIISRIFEQYPELLKNVDLITGASAGGILALALAKGTSPMDTVTFYKNALPKVFADTLCDDIKDLGNLIGADYDLTPLSKILRKHFGATLVKDLEKNILIPSFDLDNEDPIARTWKPKFFNSFQQDDRTHLVADIALRSSAAPSYFPSYQGYIDGGIAANSPALSAVAQALDSTTGGQSIDKIKVLSIGAGSSLTYVSGKKLDWGTSQWARLLAPMFLDAMQATAHYQCEKLLKGNYYRVDTVLSEKVELDDVSKVGYLETVANNFDISPVVDWVKNNWNKD